MTYGSCLYTQQTLNARGFTSQSQPRSRGMRGAVFQGETMQQGAPGGRQGGQPVSTELPHVDRTTGTAGMREGTSVYGRDILGASSTQRNGARPWLGPSGPAVLGISVSLHWPPALGLAVYCFRLPISLVVSSVHSSSFPCHPPPTPVSLPLPPLGLPTQPFSCHEGGKAKRLKRASSLLPS